MSFAVLACALSVGVVNDTKHSKVKADDDFTREEITFRFAGTCSGFDAKQIFAKPEKYKITDTKNNYYGTTETTFYVTNGVTFGHDSQHGISFPLDYHKGETFDLVVDYTDFTNGYLVAYAQIRVCLSKELKGLTCETLIGGNSAGISYITSTSTNSMNTLNKGTNSPISGKAVFRFTVPETVEEYTSLYVKDIWFRYYTKLPSYNVSFDYGDGRAVENHKVYTKDSEVVPYEKEPTREGYVFAGWAKEDGTAYDYTVAVTSDTAVHAVWEFDESSIGDINGKQLAFNYKKTVNDDESVTYHDFYNSTINISYEYNTDVINQEYVLEVGMLFTKCEISRDSSLISELPTTNVAKVVNEKKAKDFVVSVENIPMEKYETLIYFYPYIRVNGGYVIGQGGTTSIWTLLGDYLYGDISIELEQEQKDIVKAYYDATAALGE